MSITSNLQYGTADDCAEILNTQEIEQDDLTAALINALKKIAALEENVFKLQAEIRDVRAHHQLL